MKTGTSEYAHDVADAMTENPDVQFAVSSEIYERIVDSTPEAVDRLMDMGSDWELVEVSRASTKHTSGAEQKCTTREVIGQRKCPRQLFGRSVTEADWQQAGRRVSECE